MHRPHESDSERHLKSKGCILQYSSQSQQQISTLEDAYSKSIEDCSQTTRRRVDMDHILDSIRDSVIRKVLIGNTYLQAQYQATV